MDIILSIGGIVLAYFVTSYFWKKLSKDEVKKEAESVAPYKVEPPVETVVVPVVEEVKTVAPELKVVTGSALKPRTTKRSTKSKSTQSSATKTTAKTPAKTTAKTPAKTPAKTRIKKPTDNA
jgi:hypothetical protein